MDVPRNELPTVTVETTADFLRMDETQSSGTPQYDGFYLIQELTQAITADKDTVHQHTEDQMAEEPTKRPTDRPPGFPSQPTAFWQVDSFLSLTPPSSETSNVSTENSPMSQSDMDQANNDATSVDTIPNVQKEKKTKKQNPKKTFPALQFPPCLICGGTSSGFHFGVTTCEACKAFFRRYLLRNDVASCKKDGNCRLSSRGRSNCFGCRLKRCLHVGMAKEKSKLGRYSASKRTETIEIMKQLSGKKETCDTSPPKAESLAVSIVTVEQDEPVPGSSYDPESELIGRKLKMNPHICLEETVTENCIDSLVSAMGEVYPFGTNIKCDEDIDAAHQFYHEKHLLKLKLFGERKPVTKEEHTAFYKKYGIDIDSRYDVVRSCQKEIEMLMERYCNFAKHIPGFVKLTYHDQANLLKAYRCDFFTVIGRRGYNKENKTMLYNGSGFHMDDIVGTMISKDLSVKLTESYMCLQRLVLRKREQAIILGIVLTSRDRGHLDNRKDVAAIQDSMTDLLLKELHEMYGDGAYKRYSKIVEALGKLREFTELHSKEYGELCKDEINLEEAPLLSEFLLEC